MGNWYGLKNEKIAEIEASIDWFGKNDKKLINYLTVAWFVTGKDKQQYVPDNLNIPKWLDRCYGIKKDKQLPAEVLPLLIEELEPYKVITHQLPGRV